MEVPGLGLVLGPQKQPEPFQWQHLNPLYHQGTPKLFKEKFGMVVGSSVRGDQKVSHKKIFKYWNVLLLKNGHTLYMLHIQQKYFCEYIRIAKKEKRKKKTSTRHDFLRKWLLCALL